MGSPGRCRLTERRSHPRLRSGADTVPLSLPLLFSQAIAVFSLELACYGNLTILAHGRAPTLWAYISTSFCTPSHSCPPTLVISPRSLHSYLLGSGVEDNQLSRSESPSVHTMYYVIPSSRTNPQRYVINLFLNFFGPPLVLAALVSKRLAFNHASAMYHVVVYILATPLYWAVKVQYDYFVAKREAKKLGVELVPEIKGKWWGNLDVLFEAAAARTTTYSYSDIKYLFDRVGDNVHTINLRVLWQDQIITRDHLVMKQMLATGFDGFSKTASVPGRLRLYDLFGDGIFNIDGAEWKAHRALTRPFFARERITDYEHFEKYSNKVVDILRKRAEEGESIDLQDLFGRFTLDAAGEFLFGASDFDTLDGALPRPGKSTLGAKGSSVPDSQRNAYSDFVNAFESFQVVIAPRVSRGALWPLWEWSKNVAEEPNAVITSWIRPLIERTLDAKKAREKAGEDRAKKMRMEEGSLLEHIAESTEDVKLVRDELVNILLASRDTTAGLLSFLFYLLALDPMRLGKLRAEILAEVPSGSPSYDDVRRLKYLRACLNETLRIFTPVPYNTRFSTGSSLLRTSELNPDGSKKSFYVPHAETPIRYAPFLMQTRRDLWGDDAAEFRPERWLEKESLAEITADPFRFIAFNAGPRICLGQNFAYNQASFLTVRILQAFDSLQLRQREDAPPGSLPPQAWAKAKNQRQATEQIWPAAGLTLYSRGGIWISMKPATANP
ncbi:cytochrome P450 [Clavulina sp. PMI_390]|nr:cytochrome P450 [Clavulina sp. PMI_390]